MITNLELPYLNAYNNVTSEEYQALAEGFVSAIYDLYANIEGNHVTRIISIR